MAERDELSTFLDRVVRESRIDSARERAELRRELESHFADCADSAEALREAIARFGSPAEVAGALARAHRGRRFVRHLLRIAIAVSVSGAVALVLQIVTNLRREARSDALTLGPGFPRAASFAALLIVSLAAAWELDVEPLCARLERRPLRLLATVVGLALVMLLFHAATNSLLAPALALSASAVDVAIWTCTIAILARADRVFARVFVPGSRGDGR
jgi:hypothetical protein